MGIVAAMVLSYATLLFNPKVEIIEAIVWVKELW